MTKSTMAQSKRIKIADILQDRHNANKGTERGQYMVDTSIEQFGAGRSILLDRDNEVIAGNKTLQALIDAGYDELLVVESDGKTAVAVKRTDMDLDDAETGARALAYADNRASEVGLAWDAEQLLADMQGGLELETWFREDELQELLEGLVEENGYQHQSSDGGSMDLEETYMVMIDCVSETHQIEVIKQLQELGLSCRVIVS